MRVLDKTGVFVIGRVASFEKGKSPSANCVFFLKGCRYEKSFKSFGLGLTLGQYIFLKVAEDDPSNINALHYKDIVVPNCYDLTTTPPEGWKEIPKDTCGK